MDAMQPWRTVREAAVVFLHLGFGPGEFGSREGVLLNKFEIQSLRHLKSYLQLDDEQLDELLDLEIQSLSKEDCESRSESNVVPFPIA